MELCRDTLCFLLFLQLLQQTVCFINPTEWLEKHIRAGVDTTPLCTNETDTFIVAVHCQIKKKENGDTCKLQYIAGQKNETECDYRISLMLQNHTVFLRLTDLTPADRGMYKCECTTDESFLRFHFSVTVQDSGLITENEQNNSHGNYKFLALSTFDSSLIAFMIIFLVTLCVIYKGNCCREQTEPPVTEEKEMDQHQMDTYGALQEPTDDLYQTLSAEVSGLHQINNVTVYENL